MENNDMSMLIIKNNGPEIVSTNYWDLSHSKMGALYVSVNASCVRLLIPPMRDEYITEIYTGQKVLILKGLWEEHGVMGIKIIFEDYSDAPFTILLAKSQLDFFPADGVEWSFMAYTRAGRVYKVDCEVRTVETISYS